MSHNPLYDACFKVIFKTCIFIIETCNTLFYDMTLSLNFYLLRYIFYSQDHEVRNSLLFNIYVEYLMSYDKSACIITASSTNMNAFFGIVHKPNYSFKSIKIKKI